jgi:hypothetical protein
VVDRSAVVDHSAAVDHFAVVDHSAAVDHFAVVDRFVVVDRSAVMDRCAEGVHSVGRHRSAEPAQDFGQELHAESARDALGAHTSEVQVGLAELRTPEAARKVQLGRAALNPQDVPLLGDAHLAADVWGARALQCHQRAVSRVQ